MFDELVLYLPAAVEIQMEIDGCGLDVVMPEAVFDIRDGLPAAEHSCCTGVSEAMSRTDMLKSFRT